MGGSGEVSGGGQGVQRERVVSNREGRQKSEQPLLRSEKWHRNTVMEISCERDCFLGKTVLQLRYSGEPGGGVSSPG